MIAPRESTLRFLSLGLNSQEQTFFKKISDQLGANLRIAKDDMDLWNHAQQGDFDLCILAQTAEIREPSYLIWLLKGLANYSQVILIYSSLPEEEMHRLKRYEVSNVFVRPVDPNQLAKSIQNALEEKEFPRESLWSNLARLNPFRRHSSVH